ncbi:MAG TPA: hypothetical protein VE960_06140, partial [bacterium]|nr:hypothetical protein [bacterium]
MSPNRVIVSAILAAVLLLAVAAQVWAEGPARESRLADDGHKLWVFFTDKGLTRGGELAAVDAFRSELPERALSRRAKVGFDVNWNDLPVATHYVDGVAATDAEIVTKSRWLNAVSVLASDEQAAAIAALPFVRETRPVASGTKRMPEFTPAGPRSPAAPDGRTLDYG